MPRGIQPEKQICYGTKGDNSRIDGNTMDIAELLRALLGDGITVDLHLEIKRNQVPKQHTVKCSYCDWNNDYDSRDSANRALRAHHQHCTGYAEQHQWITAMQNGHSHED